MSGRSVARSPRRQPLAGRAALVTRPAGATDPLVARLEGAGLRVHAVPTVLTRQVPPGGELDLAVAQLERFDWVVVTSVVGVAALRSALERVGHAVTSGAPRSAAVGPATARALREAGLAVDVEAPEATGRGLLPALQRVEALAGKRVLLPRASAASSELPALLREAGADVREVVAYETVEGPQSSREALRAALADPLLGVIVVASGSAVRGLVALADGPVAGQVSERGQSARLRALPFVSIGPSTSAEVRRFGLDLAAEAAAPTVDALVDAVLGALGTAPADARTLPTVAASATEVPS